MARRKSRSPGETPTDKPVDIEAVRGLALALPEVEEVASGGRPVFRVKGKWIARLNKDRESLLIKIDYLKRDILTNAEPDTFYVTDFYRCYPMIFVRLSRVRIEVLRDLLEQAWRLEAPRRLLQAYDARLTGGPDEQDRARVG